MADQMKQHNIVFILIQIDEAHSSAWPIGLDNQPEPQASFEERVERANIFAPTCPFPVYVDTWSNDFAETYHAWPDKYYCFDQSHTVIAKSEYGTEGDENALIKVDCIEVISQLINKSN